MSGLQNLLTHNSVAYALLAVSLIHPIKALLHSITLDCPDSLPCDVGIIGMSAFLRGFWQPSIVAPFKDFIFDVLGPVLGQF